MFVPNAQAHTRGEALRHAKRLGLFSSLRIPIVIGAQFERVLALQWERVIPEPAPSVIAVMRRFADQAGLAIEQAARRQAQDETRALQAVTEALAAAATPSDVGSAIVRQGVRALGARAATVYAVDEDGEELELVASEGYPREMMSAWERIPLDAATPLADAIRSGEIVACASVDEIAARYPWFERRRRVVRGRSADRSRPGDRRHLHRLAEARHYGDAPSLVVGLARQAAQALDRAQLFERERASAGRLRKLQAVTAALSQAVTLEDVSRACLEHATTGIVRRQGLVVLRAPGATPDASASTSIAAIGLDGPDDEIPESAAAPIAACLEGPAGPRRRRLDCVPARQRGARRRSCPRAALAEADREWLLTLVSQGEQALDRAGATRPSAASRRRCSGASCRSACRR